MVKGESSREQNFLTFLHKEPWNFGLRGCFFRRFLSSTVSSKVSSQSSLNLLEAELFSSPSISSELSRFCISRATAVLRYFLTVSVGINLYTSQSRQSSPKKETTFQLATMMVVAKGLVRERRTPVVAGASSLQSRSMRRILEFRAAQEENNYTTSVAAERHFSEA